MGFEIDFIHVGDKGRSGDAIAFRFGELNASPRRQTVGVIDGGTKETGALLVEHLEKHYQTDRVDYVFSTHPDGDHASGLTVVLERMKVGNLMMHLPWNHAGGIRNMLERAYSIGRLETALVRALSNVDELEKLASKKGIKIYEPFSDGLQFNDGVLRILGPDKGYYQQLLPDFRDTPERSAPLRRGPGIVDNATTSAENNSSVILHMSNNGLDSLFTADAGIPALTRAADVADIEGKNIRSLNFIQVPHHGSRRNVGPAILNRLMGSTAFISVCKEGAPKHPSQSVINAFTRKGAKVYKTNGSTICHRHDAPDRGWVTLTPLPILENVEEADE
jgi:beta-lactamase superfamily II metal-dependent hydrolase